MASRILWIDNDRLFLGAHKLRLELEGYLVTQSFTLKDGAHELETAKYDLLILDVMMPVAEDEIEEYPQSQTNGGRQAGLVFYRRYKKIIEEKKIKILVFTIREDTKLREMFIGEGLLDDNIMTKELGGDTAVFLARVNQLLQTNGSKV
jgi:CheY-like chemotaxis protein